MQIEGCALTIEEGKIGELNSHVFSGPQTRDVTEIGLHPFMLMFSNCRKVHDVMTEIELRSYRELMFFIPVTYRHQDEERMCSFVPVLYLEYLIGVIGGLYLASASTHPGGGVSAACGANAAREILMDLKRPNTVPEDDFYDE